MTRPHALVLAAVLLFAQALTTGCAKCPRPGTGPKANQSGQASYYADRYHGRTTANGETFDMHALTAAHRTLPFNARVRVTNLNNGRFVTVRINDRGPFVKGRVIDLSYAAARKIDMVEAGVVPVHIELIEAPATAVVGIGQD